MTVSNQTGTRRKTGLIVMAYIAFISLGLPDGLLGVAWPSIRGEFGLPLDSLGLLLVATTTGYLTSSFFNGKLMARLGVGKLLALSCFLTGASLLGYTLAPVWGMLVLLGVFAGFGAGAIDAGINTYVASEHSDGLMQWLHASFGVGITLGPIIMTAGLNLFGAWRLGYIVVGVAQILLALIFGLTSSLWKRPTVESDEPARIMDYKTPLLKTLRRPSVWVSIALFFIYTGLELTLGHWTYSLLTEARGVPSASAGLWAGSYWAMFTVGRALAGLYTNRIGLDALLRGSILGALAGAALLWWNPFPAASLLGVAVVGFAIAPIFPALMSGTSARVGQVHAANTIGMQISAAGVGGAAIPGLAGILARRISLEVVPVYMTVLFAVLLLLYLFATSNPQAAVQNATAD